MPGKLGRPTEHRNAMLRGLVTYLLENGKIHTSSPLKIPVRCLYYTTSPHLFPPLFA